MGKTAVALTVWSDLRDFGLEQKAIIVAPPRVAQTVWPNEPQAWEHLKHLNIVSLSGETPANRLRILKSGQWDGIAIGYQNLRWLAQNIKHIPKGQYRLIADEVHRLSKGTGAWSRAWARVRKRGYSVIGLTGSPATNGYRKLYGQTKAIDGGERLGSNIKSFQKKYMEPHPRLRHVWTFRDECKPIVRAKIADITFNYKAEDYIKVSEIIEEDFYVELPPDARKAYLDMEKKYFTTTEDGIISASNAGVARQKLQQLASGFLYSSPDDDDFVPGTSVTIHEEKLEQLKLLIEQANCPVLIAVQYREEIKRILEGVPSAVYIKDVPAADLRGRWDSGDIPALVTHPESAMEGLTLHGGGNIVIWFSPTVNLLQYEQFNARLQKINPDKPVRVLRIVAKDTVDDVILSAVKSKDKDQTNLRAEVNQLLQERIRARLRENVI